MNKDRAKGTIDEMVGSAKRKAGELTGNTKLQVEGMAQQAKGKVENAWGKAKDAAHEVVQDARLRIDAHVELTCKDPAADADRNKSA
jgi:uncharacterized protein YjbJ (UPF0337 family)